MPIMIHITELIDIDDEVVGAFDNLIVQLSSSSVGCAGAACTGR